MRCAVVITGGSRDKPHYRLSFTLDQGHLAKLGVTQEVLTRSEPVSGRKVGSKLIFFMLEGRRISLRSDRRPTGFQAVTISIRCTRQGLTGSLTIKLPERVRADRTRRHNADAAWNTTDNCLEVKIPDSLWITDAQLAEGRERIGDFAPVHVKPGQPTAKAPLPPEGDGGFVVPEVPHEANEEQQVSMLRALLRQANRVLEGLPGLEGAVDENGKAFYLRRVIIEELR